MILSMQSPGKLPGKSNAPKLLVLYNQGSSATLGLGFLTQHFSLVLGPLGSTGEEGIRSSRIAAPDLIFFEDFSTPLPAKVIFRVLDSIRHHEATDRIPLILYCSPLAEDLRVQLFSKGLDDLWVSPMTHQEILARVSSKLQRVRESRPEKQVLECGKLLLDPHRMEVVCHGKAVLLTVLEFKLLQYFIENQGRVLSRRKILNAVWRDSVVSDRTVDAHIMSLRKKLRSMDPVLSTVYGAGYALRPAQACPGIQR